MSNSEAKIEIYSQSQLFTPENQGADTKEISLCAIAHSRLKILDMIDEPKVPRCFDRRNCTWTV